jgi:hypothetical protein
MSKLTLHLQSAPGWVSEFVKRSGTGWIKWIDPPEQNPFPGIKTVARYFIPDNDSNAMVERGIAGANDWWNWMRPRIRSWCWCHEGPNEPQPMADKAFRVNLDLFTAELARLMHGAGLRLVGMNWGVGWPDINHAPGFRNSLAVIDYLGLHEYDAPTMLSHTTYYGLRHRRTIQELKQANCRVPPILVGECGIDYGIIYPGDKKGWKTACNGNEDEYLHQLELYSAELDKDTDIVAAFIFTVCGWDWGDFNVTAGLGTKLAGFVGQELAPVPPSPPPPSPPTPGPIPDAGMLLIQEIARLTAQTTENLNEITDLLHRLLAMRG